MYIVLPIYYITYKVSVFIDNKIVCLEEILVIKDPSKTIIQLAKGASTDSATLRGTR